MVSENICSKSTAIVFRRRNYKMFVNGTTLEQVESYTYLSINFHRTGNLKHASLSLSKKGNESHKFPLNPNQAICPPLGFPK